MARLLVRVRSHDAALRTVMCNAKPATYAAELRKLRCLQCEICSFGLCSVSNSEIRWVTGTADMRVCSGIESSRALHTGPL